MTLDEILKLVANVGTPAALCFFLVRHVLKRAEEAEKRNDAREQRYLTVIDTTCVSMTAALRELNDKSKDRHHETHQIIREEGSATRRLLHEKGRDTK